MNATYTMEGDKVRVERFGGNLETIVVYRLGYEDLQGIIDTLTLDILRTPGAKTMQLVLAEFLGAMAYLRENLTLEQANAKYATDVNTAWARW